MFYFILKLHLLQMVMVILYLIFNFVRMRLFNKLNANYLQTYIAELLFISYFPRMATTTIVGNLEKFPKKLHIIEWHHMDLLKFYPMALIASGTVRGLLYPFNVVKSRLQLQRQNHIYRGMRHAFFEIYRNEGVTAFYRGFWVTMPQIAGSFVYSTCYEKVRSMLHLDFKIESATIVSVLAGGMASTLTQIFFVPTDVISQYMMIYNNPKHFTGDPKKAAVLNYLRDNPQKGRAGGKQRKLGIRVVMAVYNVDGYKGFYRGFLSSLLLYFPHSMCFWFAYYTWLDLLKRVRTSWSRSTSATNILTSSSTTSNITGLLYLQGISGCLGGISAACLTNSLEILRVRIQVHRTSYAETLFRLYQEEGRRVFIKGLAPRMINMGLQSFLIMTGYEIIKRLSVLPEYRDAIVW